MDAESFLKQKILDIKLPAAPFGVAELEAEFQRLDDTKNSALVTAQQLSSVLENLRLSKDEVKKHTTDFFSYFDAKKSGFINYRDFVRDWSRYQLFWILRYLGGQQQRKGKTANDIIPSSEIKQVLESQLGAAHAEYTWNHLAFTVHSPEGASLKEVAHWYFGGVQNKEPHRDRRSALLVIDVQNDFCPPDGSLAVNEGTVVIPIINNLRKNVHFNLVAHTQDFHPADHISFASNNKDNPECKLFTPLQLKNGQMQVMWPDHCVQGSNGTKFHKDLVIEKSDKIVQKGKNREVDSYSGFYDNDKKEKTELADVLKKSWYYRCVRRWISLRLLRWV